MPYKRPRAERVNTRVVAALSIIIAGLVAWAVRHLFTLYYQGDHQYSGARLEQIYALAFLLLAFTTTLSLFDKPKKTNRKQQAVLNKLHVVACVPAYNEDPVLLERCLESIISQSRKPDHVYIIDDGSTVVNYKDVKKTAREKAKKAGIKFTWVRTPNGGKRHAQCVAIKATPKADVYLTVDSDSVLDYDALKEGLKPFTDPRVNSVAGVVMSINSQKNLLTRFTDLWFVMGQLVDRSAMSTMGSVLVNSGVLALYRAKVIRKYLNGYLNESFMGRHVEFSDDSMLTLYCLAEGRAVQQRSSFAFTAMPENFNHHLRQYIRWMRGAFIRTFWRFKYLPLNGFAYWYHLMGWLQMMVSLAIFIALFVVNPVVTRHILPTLILIPILVGYGQALFYLTIKRSDEKFASQFLTYLTAIIASMWAYFGLRFVRWYAIVTCRRTGWGTRKTIEIKA